MMCVLCFAPSSDGTDPIWWCVSKFFVLIMEVNKSIGSNRELIEFMTSVGIFHKTSFPYAPKQNGVAERKNQYLLEVTQSLLHGGHFPLTCGLKP